jgi:hypothetical protein
VVAGLLGGLLVLLAGLLDGLLAGLVGCLVEDGAILLQKLSFFHFLPIATEVTGL